MLKYLQLTFAAMAFLLAAPALQAQTFTIVNDIDHIYLLNGEEIQATVESVQGDYILYKPYDEEGSPAVRVAKTEVDRVKMANGTELWYNRLLKEEKPEEEAAVAEPRKERKKKRPVSSQKLQRQR